MFKIEKFKAKHIEASARIIGETPLFKKYGFTASAARKTLRKALASRDNDMIVASSGRDVLGFAWIAKHAAFQRSPYLRLIAVSPSLTSQGVGKALLDVFEIKYVGIFLLVTQSNLRARRFYRNRGYRQLGTIPHFVKKGITECIYYKAPSAS